MIFWIGFAAWLIGVGVLLCLADDDHPVLKWVFYIIAVIGINCYGIGSKMNEHDKIYDALAKDVNLKQVVVQGQNDFQAKVQITYRDGKLDSVELVPETTVPAEPLMKEEPKKQ